MFRDRAFPWVLPAVGLFAIAPHPASFLLVVFGFIHWVRAELRNGR